MVSQIFYHINNTIIDGEIGMRSFQEYSFLPESKTEQDLVEKTKSVEFNKLKAEAEMKKELMALEFNFNMQLTKAKTDVEKNNMNNKEDRERYAKYRQDRNSKPTVIQNKT